MGDLEEKKAEIAGEIGEDHDDRLKAEYQQALIRHTKLKAIVGSLKSNIGYPNDVLSDSHDNLLSNSFSCHTAIKCPDYMLKKYDAGTLPPRECTINCVRGWQW